MKKFLFLLAAAVVMSASAGNFVTSGIRTVSKKANIHADRMVSSRTMNVSKEAKQVAPIMAAVIDSQPEGELKTYNRTGGAFYYSSGLYIGEQTGKAYVVWADNNKVYLKDPVYGLQLDSWVEGTVSEDGTTITVPLGQTIYDAGDYTLDLCWMSTDYSYPEDGDGSTVNITYTVDERVTEAVYTINGDNLELQGTEGDLSKDFPEYCVMTGLSAVWSDDGTWQGCCDFGTTYTYREAVDPLVVLTEPGEGEMVTYTRAGQGIGYSSWYGLYFTEQEGKAYVVYGDDNKVWLQDPIYSAVTGAWVEGTVSEDGTTITVPADQCIYWSEDGEYGLILKNVILSIDEEGNVTTEVDERATEFTYAIEDGSLILQDTYGDMDAEFPTEMRGMCGIWNDDLSFSGYMDWNTVYNPFEVHPAVPADPSLDEAYTGYADAWYDCGDESGYSKFRHYIKLEDVDGNAIDGDFVTYSIFTDDDQLFTFDYATYNYDIEEDMTELPYSFSGYDLTPSTTYFYRTNAPGYETFFNQRIGIQVYYTVDGVRNASNIVYYNLPTYATEGVPADPTMDEWYDSGSEGGYSKIYFTISEYTTEGERMDATRMYYSIFVDYNEEPFVFPAADYTYDLTEDMTLVPYMMSGVDFHNYYDYMYRTNAEGYEPLFTENIGIQVYYLCDNGEMTASNIAWLYPVEPTSVNDVTAGKTVAGVRYFNMAGQEMRQANGICIAVTTYTDGTTSAVKVVK